MPPSVDDGLPKDPLARFVVEIVEQWDLSRLTGQIRGAGAAAYHPEMLLGLLIYGYATGTFGSRRIEQATYDSLAFRTLATNTHLSSQRTRPEDIMRVYQHHSHATGSEINLSPTGC